MNQDKSKLVTAEVVFVSPIHYVELREALAKATAKMLKFEGRLREMVDALNQGNSIVPTSCLHEQAKEALDE